MVQLNSINEEPVHSKCLSNFPLDDLNFTLSYDQTDQINNFSISNSEAESSDTESWSTDSFSSDQSDNADANFLFSASTDEENSEEAPIYKNAIITVAQFNLLLTLFISRFSLSKICSEQLLKLVIFLLPKPNKICKSVSKLYLNNNIKKPIKKIVCSTCWEEKGVLKSRCKNDLCVFDNKDTQLEVFYLDSTQQLESILKRKKQTILKYKNVGNIFFILKT